VERAPPCSKQLRFGAGKLSACISLYTFHRLRVATPPAPALLRLLQFWGLWWAVATFTHYTRSLAAKKQFRTRGWQLLPFGPRRLRQMPLEPFVKLVLPLAGILAELWLGHESYRQACWGGACMQLAPKPDRLPVATRLLPCCPALALRAPAGLLSTRRLLIFACFHGPLYCPFLLSTFLSFCI
jgi:hypothetical protein